MKVFNVVIATLLLICFTRAVLGVEPLSLRTLLIELQSIEFGLEDFMYELQQLREFNWDLHLNSFWDIFDSSLWYKLMIQFVNFVTGCINAISELVMVIVDTLLSLLYFAVRILGFPDIPLAPNT